MKSMGTTRTVLLRREQRGYIHGFTENYVKVKAPWNRGGEHLKEISLTKIDEDGLVRFEGFL